MVTENIQDVAITLAQKLPPITLLDADELTVEVYNFISKCAKDKVADLDKLDRMAIILDRLQCDLADPEDPRCPTPKQCRKQINKALDLYDEFRNPIV